MHCDQGLQARYRLSFWHILPDLHLEMQPAIASAHTRTYCAAVTCDCAACIMQKQAYMHDDRELSLL